MAEEATQDTATEAAKDQSQDVAGESTADNEQDQEVEGAEALGDPGKQALERMKADRNKARQDAKATQDELASLKAQVEGREKEHKAEQEAQKVRDEALSAANDRILKAEIRAAAASKLADPKDALRFLDLTEFEVSDEGEVDSGAISDAIDGLLEKKSYLAAQGGNGTVFESPGSHREERKSQVSKSELDRMSAEEVTAARAEGRLDDLLGIKN